MLFVGESGVSREMLLWSVVIKAWVKALEQAEGATRCHAVYREVQRAPVHLGSTIHGCP